MGDRFIDAASTAVNSISASNRIIESCCKAALNGINNDADVCRRAHAQVVVVAAGGLKRMLRAPAP